MVKQDGVGVLDLVRAQDTQVVEETKMAGIAEPNIMHDVRYDLGLMSNGAELLPDYIGVVIHGVYVEGGIVKVTETLDCVPSSKDPLQKLLKVFIRDEIFGSHGYAVGVVRRFSAI